MFRFVPLLALTLAVGCNAFQPDDRSRDFVPKPLDWADPLPVAPEEPPAIHLETSPTAGIYVADKLGGEVVRYHRSSGRVLDIMGERLDRPTDVILHAGIFYVSAKGPGAGMIHRFDAMTHEELAPLVLDGGVVAGPSAILVRGHTLVVVGASTENLAVLDLDTGALLAELSEGVTQPHDVALGPDNLLYLSHEGAEHKVMVWNPDTDHLVRELATPDEIDTPAGLAFLADADGEGHDLLVADLVGDEIHSFNYETGEAEKLFAPAFRPTRLATTPVGQVLVTSPDGLLRFDPAGELLEISAKAEAGGLRAPLGVLHVD